MLSYLEKDASRENSELRHGILRMFQRVQRALKSTDVNADSKTFVDMAMRHDPEEIMLRWRAAQPHGEELDDAAVIAFMRDNFEEAGSDLARFALEYGDLPADYLGRVKCTHMKNFATSIHKIWATLAHKTADEVEKHPARHTLIPLKNPFIIPGGRFREVYYWDAYWIILGILHSGLHEFARGMIDNMVDLVDRFGFIPNGTRTYYLYRSQPPLLCEMVLKYGSMVDDAESIKKWLPLLIKEWEWWMDENKSHVHTINVDGQNHTLNKWCACTEEPRPEGDVEDLNVADGLNESEAKELYRNIASACEAGMDFSSKWFPNGQLKDIKTTEIIPVDLNSYLAKNEATLIALLTKYPLEHMNTGNVIQRLESSLAQRKRAMNAVLWCSDMNTWCDAKIGDNSCSPLKFSHATNFYPLWAECYLNQAQAQAAAQQLPQTKLLQVGGIPSSEIETGQQWDFPNVWPPQQYFIVQGLRNLAAQQGGQPADLAKKIASAYVYSTYLGYTTGEHKGHFYEKYNATVPGQRGKGGEYVVQEGFGWTNGLALHFIHLYGDELSHERAEAFGKDPHSLWGDTLQQ
eukprot:TRINITY_DN95527_c0_g1_i1.p1 TRINITY_DN95527_c0_g1~~TRINITY_DN95527_c0_g1_i1.p1  ORF type:complete len:576 (-),score=61.77 TRINITY_DN95527_c0_g1_i1:92-1819(-)